MIETNIKNAILADTVISALVDTRVYFPYAPKDAVLPYISFFRISGVSNFHETVNNDLYQIDIYTSRNDYAKCIKIKSALKKLFKSQVVKDCVMIYEDDTQQYQFDEENYRIIMTYTVNNRE
jgi:hypothetical protein